LVSVLKLIERSRSLSGVNRSIVNDPNASATGSPFFLPEKKHQPTAHHTIMQIQNVQMENNDFLIEVVDMRFGRSAEHKLDFFS